MSNGRSTRSSLFTGLLLVLLGALLLVHRFDPAFAVGYLSRRYWPVLIILWGVARLIEQFSASRSAEVPQRLLTGGEAALLVLLFVVLGAFAFTDWIQDRYPDIDIEIAPFNQRSSEGQELAARPLSAGAHIAVQTNKGNIAVRTFDGNEMHVSVDKSASASTDFAAQKKMRETVVLIEQTADGYRVRPMNNMGERSRTTVDLDVVVPKAISLQARTEAGDISISGVAGSVDAGTRHGDIEIHHSGSDVRVELEKGNVRISNVAGNVAIVGHGTDLEAADIVGDATVEGNFYGTILVRNVAGTTRYTSQRSDLTLEHMAGRMALDSSNLEISDVAGSAKLQTHNKDIKVENVDGGLAIADAHGQIRVSDANPPREEVEIINDTGEVDLTLPPQSSFEVSAESRSGEVENDFEAPSLKAASNEGTERVYGTFGSRGPKITIVTSYGTIHLRKSH